MNHTTANGSGVKRAPEFAIVPRHIWRDRSLTNADRAVYDALASHAGGKDKRECWPSTDTLASESGTALGTVSKSLSWLIARGHIQRSKEWREMPDGRVAEVIFYKLAWANNCEATKEDRVAFFRRRHASRRERSFPPAEISTGGNSTGGNGKDSTGGNTRVSTVETAKFPYVETQENRPPEQTHLEQTTNNITHTQALAAKRTKGHEPLLIKVGMPTPKFAYFNPAAHNLLREDIDQAWQQFASQYEGEVRAPNTLGRTFKTFLRNWRASRGAQGGEDAGPQITMNWDWYKSPAGQQARSYGFRKLNEEDVTTALEKFVRNNWGKLATDREWLFRSANWIDNEHRWMRERGMEVL